jgi:hypothetical protein
MNGNVPPQPQARAAAWGVLIAMGGTTMTFNIWHATHAGHMPIGLALLYGMSPVLAAMGLSHIVAAHQGGTFMKAVTFTVMLGAMALSIGATGDVVGSAAGPLRWLFGGVLDAAALVALQVILSPASRAAARAAKRAANGATIEAVNSATGEAVSMPSAEPAAVPPAMPAEKPRQRGARLSKDHEAEKARAEYRKSARRGDPLSDRALGDLFGRSRTWGATRIREVESSGLKLAAGSS